MGVEIMQPRSYLFGNLLVSVWGAAASILGASVKPMDTWVKISVSPIWQLFLVTLYNTTEGVIPRFQWNFIVLYLKLQCNYIYLHILKR